MDLYKLNIIDHYKNPRNFGRIKNGSASSHAENPSCGDNIVMDVIVKKGKIVDIKFSGNGCALSIASASMLSEKVRGQLASSIIGLNFDDMQKMLGVKVNPAREKCVMLSLEVLKKLIQNNQQKSPR